MFSLRFIFLFIIIICEFSCTYEKPEEAIADGNYPKEIATILLTKCANEGCHNQKSKIAAGGLSVETWNQLFEGTTGGAAVIPFRPDFSTVLFFSNTDTSQGLALLPTMPVNAPHLPENEYLILKNWIAQGAPDKKGTIKFNDGSAEKYYVINHGSDVVSVFEAESNLEMRCVTVGDLPSFELPQAVHVSPDNQNWYVVFQTSGLIQKFSVNDNSLQGEINTGLLSANNFCISPDSKFAYIGGNNIQGKIVKVKLDDMSVVNSYNGFDNPQNLIINPDNNSIYILPQFGNYICKATLDNITSVDTIILDQSSFAVSTPLLDPRSILFNADHSKYYIACQRSSEIKVFETFNDSLLATISVGLAPAAMAISESHSLLLVTCSSQPNTGITIVGTTDIIDLTTNTNIKSVVTGHQPRGITVSERYNKAVVSNRNVSHGGPAAHHTSPYGGQDGYVTGINLNTLELISGFKAEVSVDPFDVAGMNW